MTELVAVTRVMDGIGCTSFLFSFWILPYVLVGGPLEAHMYGVFNMVFGLGDSGNFFRFSGVALFRSHGAVADMHSWP